MEQLKHNNIQFQCLFSLESWKQRQIQIYFSFKIVIGLEWQSQPERDICFHIQCTCSCNIFLQNGRKIIRLSVNLIVKERELPTSNLLCFRLQKNKD